MAFFYIISVATNEPLALFKFAAKSGVQFFEFVADGFALEVGGDIIAYLRDPLDN